MINNY